MYRITESKQISSENFQFPTQFKLDPENRWVILSELIPWSDLEKEYAQIFEKKIGAPAKSFRIALGSLIIKEILEIKEEEEIKNKGQLTLEKTSPK